MQMAPRVLLVPGVEAGRAGGWQDSHATGFVQSSTAPACSIRLPLQTTRKTCWGLQPDPISPNPSWGGFTARWGGPGLCPGET